jgi:hypothetical protein
MGDEGVRACIACLFFINIFQETRKWEKRNSTGVSDRVPRVIERMGRRNKRREREMGSQSIDSDAQHVPSFSHTSKSKLKGRTASLAFEL